MPRDRRSYPTQRDYISKTRERERSAVEYSYRGERWRKEWSRSRSPPYRAGQRQRGRSSSRASWSCERSLGTSTSQSFLSPSLTPVSPPTTPGTPLGYSTPIMTNNNLSTTTSSTSTVCQVTDIKLFLTNSLSRLGLGHKEVSHH